MKIIYPIGIFMLVALLSGCAGRFPLVGYDNNGNPKTNRINADKYSDNLAEGMVSIQDSVIPALEDKETETKWQLRSATIGFGVQANLGFGPLAVGIKPRIRAAFTNGENAPIP